MEAWPTIPQSGALPAIMIVMGFLAAAIFTPLLCWVVTTIVEAIRGKR